MWCNHIIKLSRTKAEHKPANRTHTKCNPSEHFPINFSFSFSRSFFGCCREFEMLNIFPSALAGFNILVTHAQNMFPSRVVLFGPSPCLHFSDSKRKRQRQKLLYTWTYWKSYILRNRFAKKFTSCEEICGFVLFLFFLCRALVFWVEKIKKGTSNRRSRPTFGLSLFRLYICRLMFMQFQWNS